MAFDQLTRLLRPLAMRVANMVSRAILTRADDSTKLQALQLDLLAGETRESVERFGAYGFTSVPLEGAEAVVVCVGGRREHALAIAVEDRRYRLKNLEPGEVAVYTDQGDKVVFKRGGTIEVTASTKVVVGAPIVELAGNTDAAVKGTTYRSAEDTYLTAVVTAVQAALSALGLGSAATALAAAQTAFNAASATYLSTKVKVS